MYSVAQAAESAMDTQDASKEASSQTATSTSNLPEAEAYATLLVTQYLVDNKLCSEVHSHDSLAGYFAVLFSQD